VDEVKKVDNVGEADDHKVAEIVSELTTKSSASNLLKLIF
jgi:hypothetical protein